MDISRETKNYILIGINLSALLIQGFKWLVLEISLPISIKVWVFAVVPILLVNIPFASKKQGAQWVHGFLFLATGAIIAFSLTTIFKDSLQILTMEYFWLGLALVAVVIHYSKSNRDSYRLK
ncbi:MAG: hypothetical protein AAF039_02975 [Bacteroidota bacterium]